MFPTITDYNQVIQRNGSYAFSTLNALTFIPSRTVPVRIFSYGSGSFAVIFKAKDYYNTFAIRCFLSADQEKFYRYKEIDNYFRNINASWLTKISFLEKEINVNGRYYPVLKMDWINGKLLNNYIGEVLYNDQLLTALQQEIVAISESLESNQIGHGDIQCGNLCKEVSTLPSICCLLVVILLISVILNL